MRGTKTQGGRVTIIANTLTDYGGGERYALELTQRLRQRFRITIVSTRTGKTAARRSMDDIRREFDLGGVEIVHLDAIGVGASAFGEDRFIMAVPKPGSISKLAGIVRESDTIYMISLNPALLTAAVYLSRLYNRRLILGVHNPTFFKLFRDNGGIKERAMSRALLTVLEQVKEFHVLTEDDKRLVEANFPMAAVHLIPVFVYSKPVRPIENKEFVVVMAGRLETMQKGIDLLAEVVDRVYSGRARSSIKFHIIGSGGSGEGIVKELAGRHRSFMWLGFVDNATLRKEMRAASLYVSTSRYENFPAAILDAQGYGLPVVAFDIKGANTIISEKWQGTLIRPFDTAGVSRAIIDANVAWRTDRKAYFRTRKRIMDATHDRFGSERILREMAAMLGAD